MNEYVEGGGTRANIKRGEESEKTHKHVCIVLDLPVYSQPLPRQLELAFNLNIAQTYKECCCLVDKGASSQPDNRV